MPITDDSRDLRVRTNLNATPPNGYQRRNWQRWNAMGRPTNRNMLLVLDDGTIFWSRGDLYDCDECHRNLRESVQLTTFDVSCDGMTWRGWSCGGRPSGVPMDDWR
jgi:hypothetical protein